VSREPLRARIFRFLLPAGTGREAPLQGRRSIGGRFGTLLELRDADGRSGWGEASPLPGYAAETPGHAAAALLNWLADAGAGRTIESEFNSWPADFGDLQLEHSPAARAAVVSAVLDLAGRRGGIAIRDLLWDGSPLESASSRLPAAGIPENGSVPLNTLVPLADADTAVQSAVTAERRGIRTIKAKLGAGPRFDVDLDILRAVRAAVGPSIAIRLDANGSWSLPEARRNLDLLVELEPEYVEEPVPGSAMLELWGSAVPLAADESLHDPEVAARLMDSDAVSVIVLKPSPLGGLDRCMELAVRAAAAGKRSVVTHSFEGPVGHGAACELGLAISIATAGMSGDQPTAVGLDRHSGLEAWRDVPVPQLRDSRLVPAAVSGHGIDPTPLLDRSGADGSI
jgi:o-succinylbenzoate synthase